MTASETLQQQHNITGQFFMPFAAAAKKDNQEGAADAPASDQTIKYADALAICEGEFNGTYFPADELASFVQRYNDAGTVTKVRMLAEHDDTILTLVGRATALRTKDDKKHGKCVNVDFELYAKTQIQQDVITQLEQMPDLIGLSICISGDLNPETYIDKSGDEPEEKLRWSWSNIEMFHIAILTWPACYATTGTIKAAAYKHADGSEFNPAFFNSVPNSDAMTASNNTASTSSLGSDDPAAKTIPTVNSFGTGISFTQAPQAAPAVVDFKSIQKFAFDVSKFAAQIGSEPNADLLGSFDDNQRKNYLADMEKLAALFAAAKAPSQAAASDAEKGSELGAAAEDNTEQLAKDFLTGTGSFANFGKSLGGN